MVKQEVESIARHNAIDELYKIKLTISSMCNANNLSVEVTKRLNTAYEVLDSADFQLTWEVEVQRFTNDEGFYMPSIKEN